MKTATGPGCGGTAPDSRCAEDDWVQSWNRWRPGATISLTIEDGGVVVYSSSQIADPNGNFDFNLWNVFDLQRGQVVTVSDGTTTKTHTVMPLYVDSVDVASDTISGRSVPNIDVEVGCTAMAIWMSPQMARETGAPISPDRPT